MSATLVVRRTKRPVFQALKGGQFQFWDGLTRRMIEGQPQRGDSVCFEGMHFIADKYIPGKGWVLVASKDPLPALRDPEAHIPAF